jgi:ubiquinone/menaquinone biosynthesis C-methylase UbiE
MDKRTERAQQKWDKHADSYDRQIAFFEKVLFAGGREWVCSRAQGDVLEIAVGTGRNLPFYPSDVRMTGVEFSPKMLAIAIKRARELGREVDLRLGDAQALEFPDETFDTVVCTLSLCSIPDDRRAVAEATRVLRPGGRLLLLEHVRSHVTPVRIVQRILEPLLRSQGDTLLREPLDRLSREGLEVETVERSKWGFVERVAARKPDHRQAGS